LTGVAPWVDRAARAPARCPPTCRCRPQRQEHLLQPALAAFVLRFHTLLRRVLPALRLILESFRVGLQLVLLPVGRVVDVHGPADEELTEDGEDRQPVEQRGDQAVAVGAVAQAHPSGAPSRPPHLVSRHTGGEEWIDHMTSVQMRVVSAFLWLAYRPRMATAERARKRIAEPKGPSGPPASLRKRHDVTTREVAGFPCHTVAPRGRPAERAAVYLHGGAYISEISPQHWTLISRMADAGVRVEVPSYGLAPQHTHRDAYPFVTAVYRDLVADVDGAAVTLVGDSAGGGLALGLAQTLEEAGLPQPRRIVLISPWLDLTLSHPDLPAVEVRDPWLSSTGLHEAARAWAGGDDPTGPRLSPGNGRLAGLAPIDLYVGTREICLPDALLLQDRAAAQGAELYLTVCEGAVHVYPLVPAPEGRAAARKIVQSVAETP
jgi:epsilon-lactone hydrolase